MGAAHDERQASRLAVKVVLVVNDGFGIDPDDGPVVGFVLVVAARPSLSLGGVLVPAGLQAITKGHKGPNGLVFLDHGCCQAVRLGAFSCSWESSQRILASS